MFQALAGVNGPLPSGMLPALKTASEAGAKKIFTALDDESKQVLKQKATNTSNKKKGESEVLEPKTFAEPGRPIFGYRCIMKHI